MLLFVCCVEMNDELCKAAKRGDIQSVTRLLEIGVDINAHKYGVCVQLCYNHKMCVLDVEMNCTSFDLKIEHSSDTSM